MANNSPRYANAVKMMTPSCSMAPASLQPIPAARFGHPCHQRDQRGPGHKNVEVQHRHAEYRAGDVEQCEHGVVEHEDAEQTQRDEALAPALVIVHGPPPLLPKCSELRRRAAAPP